MSRKILGIDIRKDSVSAVLLQSDFRGKSIEAHAHSSLADPNGMKDGVSNCLSGLMKQTDITGATCVAAYPAEKILFRNISRPL